MKRESPDWFVKADNRLVQIYRYISYIGTVCLIAIMLIAFINVVGEKLAKAGLPISGLNSYSDWIAFLHVPIVFLSCGFITIERGHTCVDILTNKLSRLVRRGTAYLSAVLGIVVSGFMTWRGFTSLLTELVWHRTTINTSSFSFVQWPFALCYCVGLAMLTFSFVWLLLRTVFNYTPPAPTDPSLEPASEEGDNV